MRETRDIKINLATNGDARSVGEVQVPPGAKVAAIFPNVRKWDGGWVAALEAAVPGGEASDFAAPIAMVDNTPVKEIDVSTTGVLRLELRSAGGGGGDEDARFVIVFND